MPSKYSNFVTDHEKKRIEDRNKKKKNSKAKINSPSKEVKKSIKESDLVI